MSIDSESLIEWFEEEKRDLPWRNTPSPYAVWVSEVMLQQTQVSVVIPYFERWMHRFPTIKELSDASLDEVIKLWEGLGYYSRARNLLEGAKIVYEKFGGNLPKDKKALSSIKGLGPYTVGAILSFAFNLKAAAVDGNVLRVAARYFHIEEDISKAKTRSLIHDLVEKALPNDKHWVVNEALIELGATVCLKKPRCLSCPLAKSCQTFRNGTQDLLPVKSSKNAQIRLFRAVALIQSGNSFLIRREEAGKIMKDLHEFPYFETKEAGISVAEFSKFIRNTLGLEVEWVRDCGLFSQSFTKYRVKLKPQLFVTKEKKPLEGYFWKELPNLHSLAFSSGHKRILQALSSF